MCLLHYGLLSKNDFTPAVAMAAGASAFIAKPFSLMEFATQFDEMMSKTEGLPETKYEIRRPNKKVYSPWRLCSYPSFPSGHKKDQRKGQ